MFERDEATGKRYYILDDMNCQEGDKAGLEDGVVHYARKKNLTENADDGNMKPEVENMSLEYQRYGRNKSTVINHTYINSGEYRNKFDHITDNININRILYSKAKEMLEHRSGTMIEDMYWVDGGTGEVVASALNEQQESAIKYTGTIERAIEGRKNLIAMHTHPQSMPPSANDFNSSLKHEYAINLVLCHDGTIIQYVARERISEILYDLYVGEYLGNGYTELEAQLETLRKLKESHDIDFWEVLP